MQVPKSVLGRTSLYLTSALLPTTLAEVRIVCFWPYTRQCYPSLFIPYLFSVFTENLIGRGGYAEVYKGCLSDGQLVAIKRLNRGTSEDQIISFLSEVGIIAHVDHPNTAKMVGYGVEGGTFLVLQLSSLGSLGSILRG